jgi:hypothetical protein
LRRTLRLLAVAPEDPQHATDVGERLARCIRDALQERAGGARLLRRDVRAERRRQAHHVVESRGDRRLEVGGDPHALLLRRMARVAGPGPLALFGLALELALQPRLAGEPAARQQRDAHADGSEQRLRRPVDGRVEPDADGRERRRRQPRGGERPGTRRVPAGGVQRDHHRDERRRGLRDEEVAERALQQQHDRDRGEGEQRRAPPPRERDGRQRQRERAHEPVVGRTEHRFQHAGGGQARREQEVHPDRSGDELPHGADRTARTSARPRARRRAAPPPRGGDARSIGTSGRPQDRRAGRRRPGRPVRR